MLECPVCCSDLRVYEHIDEMLEFDVKNNGEPEETPRRRKYVGRTIQIYAQCTNNKCRRIYEFDPDTNKVLTDNPLPSYPPLNILEYFGDNDK